MDVASAILVLQLQIQESEEILATHGIQEGVVSAFTVHLSDLRQRLQILQDHSIAYQPLGASDTDIIEGTFGPHHELHNIEPQYENREQESLAYIGLSSSTSTARNDLLQDETDHQHENETTINQGIEDLNNTATPDPSESQSHTISGNTCEVHLESSCTACLSNYPENSLIRCPCEHYYCAECLVTHFEASICILAFPPACCGQVVPLELAQPHLSERLLKSYHAKIDAIENPTTAFCALLHCQARIPPENIANYRAMCTCGTVTCVMCRFVAHEGPCEDASDRVTLLTLAVHHGFRACYRCGEVYERSSGCNHMTCTTCSAEFCYNCGRQWLTCQCGDFAEQGEQLIRTGEVVDNRTVQDLVRPVACLHRYWGRIRTTTTRRCFYCRFNAGHYLECCRGCQRLSCTRCVIRRRFETDIEV